MLLGRAPLGWPQRWLLVAMELLAVAGLLAVAVWAWRRASIPMRLPEFDNPAIPDTTSRMSGPWAASAVLAATAAGLLVLDGVRQAVLAVRGRRLDRSGRTRRSTAAQPPVQSLAVPPPRIEQAEHPGGGCAGGERAAGPAAAGQP